MGGDLTSGALAYVVIGVQDGTLTFSTLDLLSFEFSVFPAHLGQGSKVGHAPISFVVLLLTQLIPVH